MSAIKRLVSTQEQKISIAVIGLVNSGKTEFIKRIIQTDEHILATANGTSELEFQTFGNLTLLTWDLKDSIPHDNPLWKRSILGADSLFFIIDSSDQEQFPLIRRLLYELIENNFPIRLLILGSKSDLTNSSSIGEIIDELDLVKLDSSKCRIDLFKFSSLTGEGLYSIEEWLDKVLFKRKERIINYVKLQASMILNEEHFTFKEAIFPEKPNINLLTSVRELKRKLTIFSRTSKNHEIAEEVLNISNYKVVIVKQKKIILALLVSFNDSIPRAIEIARNLLKILLSYNSTIFYDFKKIVKDIYPLDLAT
ncbi:MAG: hypothetical protein FK734_14025 [Asgard group archaeon]|nr:hypothetical protein [Asgard group archaeon]